MPNKVWQTTVLEHRVIAPQVRLLTISAPAIAVEATPGQFVHVRVADGYDPLLRHPISIAASDMSAGTLKLIYRIVGRGTGQLDNFEAGDSLDVMGPLGKGFSLTAQRPLLVGGGMGLAPLLFLASALFPRKVTVLMGGCNCDELFWQKLFAPLCQDIHITTDDGSMGKRGFTVDALPDILAAGNFDQVYACGPRPMLEGVARLAKAANLPCQISLENFMACGVGACLSCTCDGNDGKRRKICSDGPVFYAEEVLTGC